MFPDIFCLAVAPCPPGARTRVLDRRNLHEWDLRGRGRPRADGARLRVSDPIHNIDELGRPRLGKGPDASTTRLTLPGQDDPPARVDAAADAPVEVPLQGSSPEGRGGCAIA